MPCRSYNIINPRRIVSHQSLLKDVFITPYETSTEQYNTPAYKIFPLPNLPGEAWSRRGDIFLAGHVIVENFENSLRQKWLITTTGVYFVLHTRPSYTRLLVAGEGVSVERLKYWVQRSQSRSLLDEMAGVAKAPANCFGGYWVDCEGEVHSWEDASGAYDSRSLYN